MGSRNRETLKNFFRNGQLPCETHFADLIDSTLNLTDEGFSKTVENGQELSTPFGHDALLSFFRDQNPQLPMWSIRFGSASDQLLIQPGPAEGAAAEDPAEAAPAPLLCLDRNQRIGVGLEDPQAELDVAGTVRSAGRVGAYPQPARETLLADGAWHDLTEDLAGCQAFEVVAGVGQASTGRFVLMHALALCTYNPGAGLLGFLARRRGIRCTQAYYQRRCDRLQLRWLGTSGKNACYRLQIRTGCDFGPSVLIQATLTQLWSDPHMAQGVL